MCPGAPVTGKLEFQQIFRAKDIYGKWKSCRTIHFATLSALNKRSPEEF